MTRNAFLIPGFLMLLSGTACFSIVSCNAQSSSSFPGMICKDSPYSVPETIDRLENILRSKDFTIMARVDHAANAAGVDKFLRPTQLLIFGKPEVGTQLMQQKQSIALDLPQKALAFEREDGKVMLVYNDMEYFADRHFIGKQFPVIGKVKTALDKLTNTAIAPSQANADDRGQNRSNRSRFTRRRYVVRRYF